MQEWRRLRAPLISEDGRIHTELCKPLVDHNLSGCDEILDDLPYNRLLVFEESFAICASKQQVPTLGIRNCTYKRAGSPSHSLESSHLELVKRGVLGIFYEKWEGYLDGRLYPPAHVQALSMIGMRRMDHLQFLLEEVIRLNIPGDFIETGVWRGGAAIFAASAFQAYGQTCPSPACRRVFVADSFQGIPPVNTDLYPVDAVHEGAHLNEMHRNNSQQLVRAAFAQYGVLSEAVVFLPGYFNETLPAARAALFTRFAVARLDGDTYESTWQARTP